MILAKRKLRILGEASNMDVDASKNISFDVDIPKRDIIHST